MLKTQIQGPPTANCPICSTQEAKVADEILEILIKKEFKKGTQIFGQDEVAHGIFLLAKGSVKIYRLSANGKEILLDILHPGSTFGENSLFGAEKYSDSAVANVACEVFYIPKMHFKPILSKHPELAQSVIKSICLWMDKLNAIIENINSPSARERVCNYLKRLRDDQSASLIHLTGKKHEVALMLGLRPETFSRVLSDLESEDLIKMNHKQIQILKQDF
ncbi:MAG TPA: Crp/Fnr family transcriptional regulator [Bdellovibrio sp.]|uniref:Crp/Fnr family transcriptional regulator n=1 Tax=Bdellovibrio sp. TaxID=28201 RepID=UPI002F10D59B